MKKTSSSAESKALELLRAAGLEHDAEGLSAKGFHAVLHASQGFHVVPWHGVTNGMCSCRKSSCASPGKHPQLREWQTAATTDIGQIVDWWLEWPDANIAAVAGPSEVLVVDIDDRNGGWDSWDAVLNNLGVAEPTTLTTATGGGGAHFIFRYEQSSSAKKRQAVRPGIDLLAGASAFLLPGSDHWSGKRYAWDEGRAPSEVALEKPPEWVLELLTDTDATSKVTGTTGKIMEGSRNSTLFAYARSLHEAGCRGDRLGAAARAMNSKLCDPPLAESEVLSIVRSVTTREVGSIGRPPLVLVSRKELGKLPAPAPLVDDVLFEHSLSMMWGDSNVGKTFLALDLAASVAAGLPWLGHSTTQGSVLYVLAEGQGSFNARVSAWEHLNETKLGSDISFLTTAVQLHEAASVNELLTLVQGNRRRSS